MKKPPRKRKPSDESPEALPDLFSLPVANNIPEDADDPTDEPSSEEDATEELDTSPDDDSAISNQQSAISSPSAQAYRQGGRGALRDLIDDNFLQFASYTICHRAIPTIEDGFKPVQRRIMHALWEKDDGRFIKVATVVGHTMQYHPHGDASIGDALVNLTNKRYLIEGQGNYGNIHTGEPAAAPRYIECRLTPLAREEIFNPKTTRYIPSYDGRNDEPVFLPSKLPLLLMLGADGIAVGLTTTVLPHNFIELLEAQISIIQNKPFTVLPDFQTGGLMDVSEYNDGNGRIRLRASIARRDNRLVITELPYGQTTEKLIESIEEAVKKKKVAVRQINDFTAEKVEIELVLASGAKPETVEKSLYAFTNCETAITSRLVTLYKNRPYETTVPEILRIQTQQLLDLLQRELEIRDAELADLFHNKTLDQIFIENRIYKRIEEQTSAEAVRAAVLDGLTPFRPQLTRDITPDDIERLLQIRIRRISLYDINKNREELDAILKERAQVAEHLRTLKKYATAYLKRLIKQYQKTFPRLTRVDTFGTIELRNLTSKEMQVKRDVEGGYIGHAIKGDLLLECSSLDKLLVLWDDGRYKMIPPPDKFFVDKNLLLCQRYDREKEMLCIYTEKTYGFTYIKRFTFGGAIQNKDYRLCPEGSKILLLQEGAPETLYVKYKPAKSQRIHQQLFAPRDIAVKGVASRGIQMTSKAIDRIATDKPRWWQDDADAPKGLLV